MKHQLGPYLLFGLLGLGGLGGGLAGGLLGTSILKFKSMDRSVTVKGLSEREYPADVVVWPIEFSEADNDLPQLYSTVEGFVQMIKAFLQDNGIEEAEISVSAPAISDNSLYGTQQERFRYISKQNITVYSKKIELVRKLMSRLAELGKRGIVLNGRSYLTEYLFTRLNEVKPAMIEEATQNARQSALKFAKDSQSKLGKIKSASQGFFSISSRDNNNPQLKKVRVVTTIEYYLSD